MTNVVKGGYWLYDSGSPASDINTTLFTHLFCAFAGLDPQTHKLDVPIECQTFSRIVKQKNPSIKTLLSIGGGNVASSVFNVMASQRSPRKAFIDSSIQEALRYGYDGLDLDWEQQSNIDEMNNMGILLNEWRAAIRAKSPSLLLTAALRFRPTATDDENVSFPIEAIKNNLDWVNVMAYDFYTPKWPPEPLGTAPHASLRDPTSQGVSGSDGISAWTRAGVPAKKLVFGIPFYGYKWELLDSNKHGISAPFIAPEENTELTYKEIKDLIRQNGAKVVYDPQYVTHYCYYNTTWISYDDVETIKNKVAYAKNNHGGLLGYFAWMVTQDSNWTLSKQASQTWGG